MDFDNFVKSLDEAIKEFPKLKKELYDKSSNMMLQSVQSNISSSTTRHSGNLQSGQQKQVGSKGGYAAVRPKYKQAPHTHLVEDGHKLVKGKRQIVRMERKEMSYKRKNRVIKYLGYAGVYEGQGNVIGWVEGRHFYRKATAEVIPKIDNLAKQMESKIASNFR